jgi:hypothetical protein
VRYILRVFLVIKGTTLYLSLFAYELKLLDGQANMALQPTPHSGDRDLGLFDTWIRPDWLPDLSVRRG